MKAQAAPLQLVCDLGGTNVRFAVSIGDQLTEHWSAPLAGFPCFEDALSAYVARLDHGAIGGLAIGAAGPVSDGRVTLTNADWTIDAAKAQSVLPDARIQLFNDLQPVARAIPVLDAGALDVIRAGRTGQSADASMLAVNVGTGFGTAALYQNGRDVHVAATEAGHMALPAAALRDVPELAKLDGTVEDLLSGKGVVALYGALSGSGASAGHSLQRGVAPPFHAADIFATLADDPVAVRVHDVFGYCLGLAIRDLILAHAAWNGVYLFGSVVGGWRAAGGASRLEDGLMALDPMSDRVGAVPVLRIKQDDAALLGLGLLSLASTDNSGETTG